MSVVTCTDHMDHTHLMGSATKFNLFMEASAAMIFLCAGFSEESVKDVCGASGQKKHWHNVMLANLGTFLVFNNNTICCKKKKNTLLEQNLNGAFIFLRDAVKPSSWQPEKSQCIAITGEALLSLIGQASRNHHG